MHLLGVTLQQLKCVVNTNCVFKSYLQNSSIKKLYFVPDIGFEIPDKFVVGYALDYNEYFRDLNVSTYMCASAVTLETLSTGTQQGY